MIFFLRFLFCYVIIFAAHAMDDDDQRSERDETVIRMPVESEETSGVSLNNLPTDVLCHIFRLIDGHYFYPAVKKRKDYLHDYEKNTRIWCLPLVNKKFNETFKSIAFKKIEMDGLGYDTYPRIKIPRTYERFQHDIAERVFPTSIGTTAVLGVVSSGLSIAYLIHRTDSLKYAEIAFCGLTAISSFLEFGSSCVKHSRLPGYPTGTGGYYYPDSDWVCCCGSVPSLILGVGSLASTILNSISSLLPFGTGEIVLFVANGLILISEVPFVLSSCK